LSQGGFAGKVLLTPNAWPGSNSVPPIERRGTAEPKKPAHVFVAALGREEGIFMAPMKRIISYPISKSSLFAVEESTRGH
jgi:hypothetical protein